MHKPKGTISIQLTDEELVKLTLAGDRKAFGQLVRKYQNSMYTLACNKLRNEHDAEDIVQEAFVKAYQKLNTLRYPKQFASWLSTITTNFCRMWLREKQRQTRIYRDTDRLEIIGVYRDAMQTYEYEVAQLEAKLTVQQVLDRLSAVDRLLLQLFYLDRLSYFEIGEFLKVKPNQIKTKLYQARQCFKKEWEKMAKVEKIRNQLGEEFTQRVIRLISGKVVDSAGDNPVALADIYANISGGKECIWAGKAKAKNDGSFSLNVEAISEEIGGHYNLFAVADGYGVNTFSRYKKSLRDVVIPLGPAGTLCGNVADTNGEPIEGVSLRVYYICTNEIDLRGEYKGFFVCDIPGITRVVTDSNGNFEFCNLPQGAAVNLSVQHPEYARIEVNDQSIFVGETDIGFVLRPGAIVRGRLTYEQTGKPVVGFKIISYELSHQHGGITAETDGNGNYKLTGLHPGSYRIRASSHPDWVAIPTKQIDVSEGGLVEGMDLKLIEGGILTGKVVDIDTHKPIQGVGIGAIGEADSYSWGSKSGPDGVYQLRTVPGFVRIYVNSDTSQLGYHYPQDQGEQKVNVENGQTLADVDFKLWRNKNNQTKNW